MHSGCLRVLAARDVDTSPQLLLSLSARVKSVTLTLQEHSDMGDIQPEC